MLYRKQFPGGWRNGSHAEIIDRCIRHRVSDCFGLRWPATKADDA
jgi:hypothetical protein